jgi:pescadillo protein
MKAHYKKIRKAKAKFNRELADRLQKLAPTYKLDHLVRERCA